MHEGLQCATLAVLLFGILLNRYDVSALRKDVDAKLDRNRDEFLRRTDAIVAM